MFCLLKFPIKNKINNVIRDFVLRLFTNPKQGDFDISDKPNCFKNVSNIAIKKKLPPFVAKTALLVRTLHGRYPLLLVLACFSFVLFAYS